MLHKPGACASAESVSKKVQARVVASFSKVSTPCSFSHVNASMPLPVRREILAASSRVSGIVVSRQHREQDAVTHGNRRATCLAFHPPSSRGVAVTHGHRAIRVVWISFRPSEPETWVRILHRPLLSAVGLGAGLTMPPVVTVMNGGCHADM